MPIQELGKSAEIRFKTGDVSSFRKDELGLYGERRGEVQISEGSPDRLIGGGRPKGSASGFRENSQVGQIAKELGWSEQQKKDFHDYIIKKNRKEFTNKQERNDHPGYKLFCRQDRIRMSMHRNEIGVKEAIERDSEKQQVGESSGQSQEQSMSTLPERFDENTYWDGSQWRQRWED